MDDMITILQERREKAKEAIDDAHRQIEELNAMIDVKSSIIRGIDISIQALREVEGNG